MVLTVSFVLSPVIGLLSPSLADKAFVKNPVGPTNLRQLDASAGASGPHDFAVRESISRLHAVIAHGKIRPAIPSRAQRCRVHRIPHPTFVTIAKRPSV
jgi:hypothetical protein